MILNGREKDITIYESYHIYLVVDLGLKFVVMIEVTYGVLFLLLFITKALKGSTAHCIQSPS